jgi:putative peptidoglycan lipid II flippase
MNDSVESEPLTSEPSASEPRTSKHSTSKQGTNLLSASAVMAAGTLLSRITGFARAILLAAAIGIGTHADLFNVAQTIPNSLYILVAGGVFNTVLVPQLVRAMKNDADHGEAYANRLMTLGALLLAGVSAVLVVLTPLFLRLIVDNSFFTDPRLADERASLITLTQLCMPMIFFYGMFVLAGQILNARQRFGPMMWAPIANNIVSIVTIIWYLLVYSDASPSGGYTTSQELLLGLGSIVGIAIQTAVLIPYLHASEFRIRPRFDLLHTGLAHTLRLSTWVIGLIVVNQVAFYVVTSRSTSGAGSVGQTPAGFTVYNNAFLITQVPHAIITVSLATVTMTAISGYAAEHDFDQMRAELNRTMRTVLALLLPIAALLLVIGPAVGTLLFSWGKAAGDTHALGLTLIAFAPGMLFFSVHYLALRGFYALEDTRTPFFLQCLIAVVNVTTAVVSTHVVGPDHLAPALAFSYTLAFGCGATASLTLLSRRLGGLGAGDVRSFLTRTIAAAAFAAGLAAAVVWVLEVAGYSAASRRSSALIVGGALVVGVLTYLMLAHAFKIDEVNRITALLRRSSSLREHGPTHPSSAPGTTTMDAQTDAVLTSAQTPDRSGVFDIHVEPGTRLANRYEIEDLLSDDDESRSWRARDTVLARSVVVQVTRSDSALAPELLAAAKQASRVSDTRFLHVLDAAADGDVTYVVREWVRGQSLDMALADGPLPPRRAAWIVREVAAAIGAAHREGVTHGCLTPHTIVITSSGGIKIVGLGTMAATNHTPGVDDPHRRDTRELGHLLYACLTARWPGGGAGALHAAPTEHGRLLRPRQVRAGVPRPLDSVTDRILGDPPRQGAPIVTADDVEESLTRVLAGNLTATAEPGLERVVPPPPPNQPPALLPSKPGPKTLPDLAQAKPPPAPPEPGSPVGRTLWWIAVAVLAVGAILLVYLVTQTGGTGKTPPPASQSSSQSTASKKLAAIPIQTGYDFDPDGENGENPDEVKYAFDGNPSTAWTTLRYDGSPLLGGLKPGVGLIVDLGSVKSVSKVVVGLGGRGTNLQLRAASASATDTAPRSSASEYAVVGSVTNAGDDATFALSKPVRTRYLLVWLTSLPSIGGASYRGSVAEIQVFG